MLPPSEEIGPKWQMRAALMEMIMLRTTFAAIAITVIAGTSFAYAADDSMSENQAIELEQNKVPAPEGVITTSAREARRPRPRAERAGRREDRQLLLNSSVGFEMKTASFFSITLGANASGGDCFSRAHFLCATASLLARYCFCATASLFERYTGPGRSAFGLGPLAFTAALLAARDSSARLPPPGT